MTRKDYIRLARALATTRPTTADYTTTSYAIGDTLAPLAADDCYDVRGPLAPHRHNTMVNHISFDAAYATWCNVVIAISDVLERDNPRFDRSRFQLVALDSYIADTNAWNGLR